MPLFWTSSYLPFRYRTLRHHSARQARAVVDYCTDLQQPGWRSLSLGNGTMDYRAYLLDDDGHVFARERGVTRNRPLESFAAPFRLGITARISGGCVAYGHPRMV